MSCPKEISVKFNLIIDESDTQEKDYEYALAEINQLILKLEKKFPRFILTEFID